MYPRIKFPGLRQKLKRCHPNGFLLAAGPEKVNTSMARPSKTPLFFGRKGTYLIGELVTVCPKSKKSHSLVPCTLKSFVYPIWGCFLLSSLWFREVIGLSHGKEGKR
jgi:hypothetical protein